MNYPDPCSYCKQFDAPCVWWCIVPSGVAPATLAEAAGAAVFLREQGANIAADAVEKLSNHFRQNTHRASVLRCGKCKLRVVGSSTPAACPDGCGPLWPVTWQEECLAAERDLGQYVEAAKILSIEKAELRIKNERLIKALSKPPIGSWAWLRSAIREIPKRIELLGGQKTTYVQMDEVLGLIDERERTEADIHAPIAQTR